MGLTEPTTGRAASAGRLDEALCAVLIERIRQGDVAAFDRLYRHTREDVARTLLHLAGRRADLEDLLQETYLRLLRAVHSFRGECAFRTFLYRVCANVAMSHLRWRWRRPEELMDVLPDAESPHRTPEEEASRRQAVQLVHAALETLTAKKRIVFVYHQLLGMKPEEIAETVGASVNTVRSRLHHARLEFHEALQRRVGRERLSLTNRRQGPLRARCAHRQLNGLPYP